MVLDPNQMNSNSSWASLIAFFIVVYIIYVPITLYYTKKFRENQTSMFITKRHPTIVLISILSSLIFISLDRPLHLLYFTCHNLQYQTCAFWSNLSLKISYPFVLGPFIASLARVWLIYFDIKFNQATQNSKWMGLINPTCNDLEKNNFFIKHKKNFGNSSFILKKVTLPIIVPLAIIFIAEWTWVRFGDPNYRSIAAITDTFIFMTILACIVVITCKTPKLEDKFNIRGEAMALVICVMVQFIFGFGVVFFVGNAFLNWYIVAIIQAHWYSFTAFIAILIQTYGVFKTSGITKRISQRISLSKDFLRARSLSKSTPIIYPSTVSRTSSISPTPTTPTTPPTPVHPSLNDIVIKRKSEKIITMRDVFANNDYFGYFCVHLMKEFSIECVLSFIEFQQFQKYILNIKEFGISLNTMDHDTLKSLKMYDLAKCIPESFIVYNINKEHNIQTMNFRLYEEMIGDIDNDKNEMLTRRIFEIKTISYRLYKKYIETGSEFEINISYVSRIEFEKLMRNYYVWIMDEQSVIDLLLIFQDIKLEMLLLLRHSFNRFIHSDEFRQLLNN